MTQFEFMDELPPKIRTNPGGWCDRGLIRAFAAALRERPGVWAKWPVDIRPHTVSTYRKRIKNGAFPAFRGGGFEAIGRNNVLYVRYIGEEHSDGTVI